MIENNLSEEAMEMISNLKITNDEMKSYRDLIGEIKEQKRRLKALEAQDISENKELMRLISKSIMKSEKQVLKIEIFIDTVENPRIREILRMKYIDNLKWNEVGRAFCIDERHARRLVNDFLGRK